MDGNLKTTSDTGIFLTVLCKLKSRNSTSQDGIFKHSLPLFRSTSPDDNMQRNEVFFAGVGTSGAGGLFPVYKSRLSGAGIAHGQGIS